jgi:hypothetical protein
MPKNCHQVPRNIDWISGIQKKNLSRIHNTEYKHYSISPQLELSVASEHSPTQAKQYGMPYVAAITVLIMTPSPPAKLQKLPIVQARSSDIWHLWSEQPQSYLEIC